MAKSPAKNQLDEIRQQLEEKGVNLKEILTPEQFNLFRGDPLKVLQEEYDDLTKEIEIDFPDPNVLTALILVCQKLIQTQDINNELFDGFKRALENVSDEESFDFMKKQIFKSQCFYKPRKKKSTTDDNPPAACPF